jgi:DNA-directed RNA polymerase subunit M/transcription elongation factor TFIIS
MAENCPKCKSERVTQVSSFGNTQEEDADMKFGVMADRAYGNSPSLFSLALKGVLQVGKGALTKMYKCNSCGNKWRGW